MCKFLQGMTGTESMRMHVFHFTHQYFLCYLHHFSNYFLKRYQNPRILSIACWRRAAYWWVWHRGSFPWVQNFGCLKFWEERDTGEWGEVKVGCMNSSLDLAVNSRFRRTERQSPIFWETFSLHENFAESHSLGPRDRKASSLSPLQEQRLREAQHESWMVSLSQVLRLEQETGRRWGRREGSGLWQERQAHLRKPRQLSGT